MYLISLRSAVQTNLRKKFADFKLITARNLFTRQELGVIQFERYRENVVGRFKSSEEIEHYKKNCIDEYVNLRLDEKRDKLKEFIFLMEGTDEDLRALKSLLVDYHNAYNNNVHYVKEFVFGTQIMRLFYILNLPDVAVEFFNDSDLRNVFEQMQTYKVLLSLLFENKRYDEIFKLYEQIRERLSIYELFPDITVNCLVFGACYQLNTPEHLQYAKDLWKCVSNVRQLNRSRYFLAGLALKQNDPKFALSLVTQATPYVAVRFIRLIAFTQLGEFEKALDIIYRTIEGFKLDFSSNKPYFGLQMIEDLKKSIEKSGKENELTKFNKLYQELETLDLINDTTLDERLCATFPPMLPKNLFLKLKQKTRKQSEFVSQKEE